MACLYDRGVRRFDPEQTPQELKPAKVPTALVFSLGTLVWLAVLAVQSVRHLIGHSVDGRVAVICLVGAGLGVLGIFWGRAHSRRTNGDTT